MESVLGLTANSESFFRVDVSKQFGNDVANAVNDMMRMLCIQFTVQSLLYFNDPKCERFFSTDFVILSLYVILGVLVYWLILKRIVQWS